ncbi:hypothetical protein A374_05426 [Fictibacillus macauensis ZFHKF-1]|uniref:IucA/IucC family siderophore biosynthesis protein n=1 Tax=Fictibacillus macauensis ZFHKF-1 TaxID=1196324 RepID=I8AL89_9BACL|nr:hypothetical protein A374_05426 [Fictibacillus macauensis ZFHKF-1]
MTSSEHAERAAIQCFLNCYIKETGNGEFYESYQPRLIEAARDHVLKVSLPHQQLNIYVPLRYWSLTGRHLFAFPIYYGCSEDQLMEGDYITLTALLCRELMIEYKRVDTQDELMLRVILSCQNIKRYLSERLKDEQQLSATDFSFIEAEQSLLIGHLLHPTPKSKQGMTALEEALYAPELQGSFALHYFQVHHSLVVQDSTVDRTAQELVAQQLQQEGVTIEQKTGYCLLPAHPLQARELLQREDVQQLMRQELIYSLGQLGRPYAATSSLRTVYEQKAPYMYKFSVPVKITNSLRVNKQKELARGVEMSSLWKNGLKQAVHTHFPDFHIIQDPAYLTVNLADEESGFEVVIRENPFLDQAQHVSLIAGLCQDLRSGGPNRLTVIIKEIAAREGRTTEEVSVDWFHRYVQCSLLPMLFLYETYGLALEAHQQNSVLALQDGYPSAFYYRDNQGYYYAESKADELRALCPALSEHSETICSAEVADERLRYYLFFNHYFGLINAFGCGKLVGEEVLLSIVRTYLQQQKSSPLLTSLLEHESLACKANLLTRFFDMDELVGAMEDQSVYVSVANPLLLKEVLQHV